MSLLASVRVSQRANVLSLCRATSVVSAQRVTPYHHSATQKASVAATADIPRSSVVSGFQPFTAPQQKVNVIEKAYDVQYYAAIAKIMKIRQKYIENRSVFIEGEKLVPLLKALGATDEDFFKRYDSDQTRHFDEVDNDLQLNTAFQALLIFKAMVFHGVKTARRPKLNYASNK